MSMISNRTLGLMIIGLVLYWTSVALAMHPSKVIKPLDFFVPFGVHKASTVTGSGQGQE